MDFLENRKKKCQEKLKTDQNLEESRARKIINFFAEPYGKDYIDFSMNEIMILTYLDMEIEDLIGKIVLDPKNDQLQKELEFFFNLTKN